MTAVKTGTLLSSTPLDATVSTPARTRESFYLGLAVAMSFTAYFGFWFTYFGPMSAGNYPTVSPIVHLHGWTFFVWYLLLPAQAGLIRTSRVAIHRRVGLTSIALGAVMIAVGLIVSTVQVDLARRPDGNPFWRLMGLPIFAIWLLFTFFYGAAIYQRKNRAIHRQFIVLASAVALGAATFRIVVQFLGMTSWTSIVGSLLPVLFIATATMYEYRNGRSGRVLAWGGSAFLALAGAGFLFAMTPGADFVENGIGWIGTVLSPLYPLP